ncbi:TauD/TfdA dioxygenase family protein [Catellatospora tritici]|uniref:TauD/TfdA dioxygenase family protein n=1 Tax=Catellatospora tritici TaxID=2851566 RepID=UPI001C2D87D4|nr:TauD/TfdA family dioxygenase [Catellatospora tritici]MBV1855873.1 TauD/TfdA family dioxygenase [Catellatospora tritici]
MSEISFRPLTPITGAEVEGVVLDDDLQPAVVACLREALLRYKVLVFRDQPMDDARQVALTDAFGGATAAHPIANGLRETPAVLRTALSEDRPKLAEAESGLNPLSGAAPRRLRTEWHIDSTFVANPNAITILRGVEIPPAGGDTLFADLEALYAGLSPSLRGYLDTLQAIHSRHNPSPVPRFDGKSAGPFVALHPLVRVHPETGRRSLLVSSVFMQAIRGLKPRESTLLLDFLLDELAGRDEIHARVRWEKDTLVMWDNRSVAHAGPVDGLMFEEERIVHRTTVVGDLPCGPNGFVSRALVGGLFEAMA